MAEHPRIDALRRRVQRDPASISFAALAEEYRRAGRHDEAIATCRIGLARHQAYLSPRVTLGRALLAVGRYDEALAELTQVLRAAPQDLTARHALAELHDRVAGRPAPVPPPVNHPAPPEHPALPALEAFLSAIVRARASIGAGSSFPYAAR